MSIVAAAFLLYFLGLVLVKAKVIVWLMSLFCLFVFATIFTRSRLQNTLLTLASLTFVLCVLEGAGIFIDPRIRLVQQAGLEVPKLVVGWGPAAAGVYTMVKTKGGHPLYDVRYTVDEDGHRLVQAGTTGPATTFLGDSFVFGVGLNDADTLPQLFADLEGRRLPVVNLGVGGFSPAQILAMMQTGIVDDDIKRSELLVQFVAPWHAERTACTKDWVAGAPRYGIVQGKVRFTGVCGTPPFEFLKQSAFYDQFIQPRVQTIFDKDIALLVAITTETIRLARDKYHKPMIIYFKREPAFLHRLSWTDDAIIAAWRAQGADVLDYSFDKDATDSYRFPFDGHPLRVANIIHAQVLARHIEERYPDSAAAEALRGGTLSGKR